MKVKIIQRGGYFYFDKDGKEAHALEGDEITMHDGTAGELIRFAIAVPAAKQAVEKKPDPVIETAESAPPKNAAKRTTKPAPRKGAK